MTGVEKKKPSNKNKQKQKQIKTGKSTLAGGGEGKKVSTHHIPRSLQPWLYGFIYY